MHGLAKLQVATVHEVIIVTIGRVRSVFSISQPVLSVRAIVMLFNPPPPFTAASTRRTMHTWVYWS